MDEDIKCPHCGTTKYRNPSLKLMVNVCGHALCENCVELLFVKGSGHCPQCNTGLRRHNFRLQLFDDHLVEKEIDIRKRVLKDFNKKEEDFDSLAEYNDYLEEIETIIFNLSNDIEVKATNERIDSYKKENAKQIIKNRGKLSKDEELIEELLEQEKQESHLRNNFYLNADKELIRNKTRLRESLVDELMFSDLPADQIMATHVKEPVKSSEPIVSNVPKTRAQVFSTGITIGKGSNVFQNVVKQVEGTPYVYKCPELDLNGPHCPSPKTLESGGYLKHVRTATGVDLAGGFLPLYPCQRALQESMCGLYFQPT